MKRVFLIVLDSLGIGAMPDASLFGDEGTNTLKSISDSDKFSVPNLIGLGLSEIDGVDYLEKNSEPIASYARVSELGSCKDTTAGHWELMGIISERPMPTYPNGFPREVIDEFEKRIGRGTLCNRPYSGTSVIKKYGKEHIESGKPIVYTSADSVFQIAAHEDIIPPDVLYEYCKIAREILVGEHSVGRVIARPFKDSDSGFVRTERRRDFSLAPPEQTLLDKIKAYGMSVISVGKISDIFASCGITESYRTHNNSEGIQKTIELLSKNFTGLCFVNLVDFDMLYGHRQDKDGYAKALAEFDTALPKIISGLRSDDVLIITADHGCDPADDSTDHTREYVPLIIYGDGIEKKNLGTLRGFTTVGAFAAEYLDCEFTSARHDRIFDLLVRKN